VDNVSVVDVVPFSSSCCNRGTKCVELCTQQWNTHRHGFERGKRLNSSSLNYWYRTTLSMARFRITRKASCTSAHGSLSFSLFTVPLSQVRTPCPADMFAPVLWWNPKWILSNRKHRCTFHAVRVVVLELGITVSAIVLL
jgi:hypothetical protein